MTIVPVKNDKTSLLKRLNSSKMTQDPLDAIPLKNLSMPEYSKLAEPFMTKQSLPSDRLKSFVVSVFPVPNGPSGAPPKQYWSAMSRDR